MPQDIVAEAQAGFERRARLAFVREHLEQYALAFDLLVVVAATSGLCWLSGADPIASVLKGAAVGTALSWILCVFCVLLWFRPDRHPVSLAEVLIRERNAEKLLKICMLEKRATNEANLARVALRAAARANWTEPLVALAQNYHGSATHVYEHVLIGAIEGRHCMRVIELLSMWPREWMYICNYRGVLRAALDTRRMPSILHAVLNRVTSQSEPPQLINILRECILAGRRYVVRWLCRQHLRTSFCAAMDEAFGSWLKHYPCAQLRVISWLLQCAPKDAPNLRRVGLSGDRSVSMAVCAVAAWACLSWRSGSVLPFCRSEYVRLNETVRVAFGAEAPTTPREIHVSALGLIAKSVACRLGRTTLYLEAPLFRFNQ